MRIGRLLYKKIISIILMLSLTACYIPIAFAENIKRIGDEHGFSQSSYDIVKVYNNLMTGMDSNYTDFDVSLAIEVDERLFFTTIPILKGLSAFYIAFRFQGNGIYSVDDEHFPDELLVYTHGCRDLVYKEGGIEMMPRILAALIYLCDSNITDSSSAEQRAKEIMNYCKENHDWMQTDGFDYYCAETAIEDNEMYLIIVIKNHGVASELKIF